MLYTIILLMLHMMCICLLTTGFYLQPLHIKNMTRKIYTLKLLFERDLVADGKVNTIVCILLIILFYYTFTGKNVSRKSS